MAEPLQVTGWATHLTPAERAIIQHLAEIKQLLDRDEKTIRLIIQVECNCNCNPSVPPPQPTPPSAPVFLKTGLGDSVTMIRFPIEAQTRDDQGVASVDFHYTDSLDASGEKKTPLSKSATQDVPGKIKWEGTFDANDGANVEYWSRAYDQSNNPSPDSVHGTITGAADQKGPDAPTNTVGPGDTAPPVLGFGKKV